MSCSDFALELARQFEQLSQGRLVTREVLEWAGRIDLVRGAKPIGDYFFSGRTPPERLDAFRPPSPEECRFLAMAVRASRVAAEDAILLVVLRHLRGGAETSLASWLVRFGALAPQDRDWLLEDLADGRAVPFPAPAPRRQGWFARLLSRFRARALTPPATSIDR